MNNPRQLANDLSVRGYHQPTEQSLHFTKHKDSVGSSLNASLSNWRGRAGKPSEPPKPIKRSEQSIQHRQIEVKLPKASERQGGQTEFRGMTLQQYFRVQSSCKTEESRLTNAESKEQTLEVEAPLVDSLQINQTDEDRYNESAQSVHTPDFKYEQSPHPNPTNTQQRIIDKYSRIPAKLKTEAQEELDYGQVFNPGHPRRHRLPSVIEGDSRTLQMEDPLFQHRRKRTTSNPHQQPKQMRFTFNDFYRGEKQRKQKVLQKVRNQKDRAAQLRINQLCMVTKYAQRFNINDAICRQIIREGRY